MLSAEYKLEDANSSVKQFDNTNEDEKFKNHQKLLNRQEQIFLYLSELNEAFQNNDPVQVIKSILAITSTISNTHYTDIDSQIIPQGNLIQMLSIFQNADNISDAKLMLQVFSALIKVSDTSNENLQILIQNSFLEILRDFLAKIQVIDVQPTENKKIEQSQKSLIKYYLEVLYQLHNCVDKDESIGMIDEIFNIEFLFSLFQEINRLPITDKERLLWFQIVEKSIKRHESINSEILTSYFELSNIELTKIHENIPYDVKILDVLALFISKCPPEVINWEAFISLDFPAVLSDFIKCDEIQDEEDILHGENEYYGDFHTISSASKCIAECARCKFVDFDFTIKDVYKSAAHFDDAAMLENIFLAYYNMACNNVISRDNFFIVDTNLFVEKAFSFTSFKLRNIIAMFFAEMIPLGQSDQIRFLVESKMVFLFIYHVFQSADVDLVMSVLNCFLKIGDVVASIFSDSVSDIFSEFIPEDIDEIFDSFNNDDCVDLFKLVSGKYSFFFDRS